MDSETSGVMPIGATQKIGSVGVHIGPLIKENNSHAAPNQFPLIFGSLNQDGEPNTSGSKKFAAGVVSRQQANVHVTRYRPNYSGGS